MLPPVYHSENFLYVMSLKGFNPLGIEMTIPNLRIIFRGEPWKEMFRYKFNLSLPKWKNKEER